MPHEKWENKLHEYKAMEVKRDESRGRNIWRPMPRNELMNKTDIEIVSQINSEIRGIYNFYRLAENVGVLHMRRLSADGKLDMDTIFSIITEEKHSQKEQVKLKMNNIRSFFPKDYTARQMEDVIMKLLADWYRKREQRNRNESR